MNSHNFPHVYENEFKFEIQRRKTTLLSKPLLDRNRVNFPINRAWSTEQSSILLTKNKILIIILIIICKQNYCNVMQAWWDLKIILVSSEILVWFERGPSGLPFTIVEM